MRRLPAQFVLASLVLVAVLALVATLSTWALLHAGSLTARLGELQLDTLERAERMEDLLFEKGFVASYLATRDRHWLVELEVRKKVTRQSLDLIQNSASSAREKALAHDLRDAYLRYDDTRNRVVALFDAGHEAEALELFNGPTQPVAEVLAAAHALARESRQVLIDTLDRHDRALSSTVLWITVVALLAALLGILFGVWGGRRVARPIYELILQVESADPERVRLSGAADDDGDELQRLSAHVTSLVARLSEQRRRLMQAEKMQAVGEIAAKLAHEILNPVAAVKAALQTELRGGRLPEQSRVMIAEADRTLSRIDGIISRLVRYARPLEAHRQPSAIQAVVDSALRAAAPALAQAEVTARTEIPPLPPAEVDPDLLAQVVTNLVVNAAQASPRGETVTVRAEARAHELVLEVVDRGHGVSTVRDRLFRPYFTTREKGHGLGLAICRNIVAEHGGTIAANDGPDGRGARMTITLPQPESAWASPS